MEHLTHITFATAQLSESVARLVKSANAFGVSDVRVYGPADPAIIKAADENPDIARLERGAGYWIWKSYVLLDAMDRMKDGDLLLYTDAGMAYVSSPAPLLALARSSDIVLFNSLPLPGTHRYWTKRDCLILMGADTPEHWDVRLVQAGVQLYRVGAAARSFVTEWRDAMRDPRVLTDMLNTCGSPNFPEFIEHRHDMSSLTVLATKHGIRRTRSAGIPPRHEDEGDYPQIFDLHKSRNPGAPRHVSLADAVKAAKRPWRWPLNALLRRAT